MGIAQIALDPPPLLNGQMWKNRWAMPIIWKQHISKRGFRQIKRMHTLDYRIAFTKMLKSVQNGNPPKNHKFLGSIFSPWLSYVWTKLDPNSFQNWAILEFRALPLIVLTI